MGGLHSRNGELSARTGGFRRETGGLHARNGELNARSGGFRREMGSSTPEVGSYEPEAGQSAEEVGSFKPGVGDPDPQRSNRRITAPIEPFASCISLRGNALIGLSQILTIFLA